MDFLYRTATLIFSMFKYDSGLFTPYLTGDVGASRRDGFHGVEAQGEFVEDAR